MKIGIVGYGHVGKLMFKQFPTAKIYDSVLNIGSIGEMDECYIIFICVPTPMLENGACDTSIVESIVKWSKSAIIVIRSTIPIGFTDYLKSKYNKRIVFQPEYYGETPDHPFNKKEREWISFGGDSKDINEVINAYKLIFNSTIQIYQSNAKDVEMAKYMENAFFATKVIFINEMFDIAQSYGVDFNKTREIWLADWRMGRDHTFIHENNRGFGGKCLPKDINSLRFQGFKNGVDTTFLDSIIKKNNKYTKE